VARDTRHGVRKKRREPAHLPQAAGPRGSLSNSVGHEPGRGAPPAPAKALTGVAGYSVPVIADCCAAESPDGVTAGDRASGPGPVSDMRGPYPAPLRRRCERKMRQGPGTFRRAINSGGSRTVAPNRARQVHGPREGTGRPWAQARAPPSAGTPRGEGVWARASPAPGGRRARAAGRTSGTLGRLASRPSAPSHHPAPASANRTPPRAARPPRRRTSPAPARRHRD